jgi:hypothetical protein
VEKTVAEASADEVHCRPERPFVRGTPKSLTSRSPVMLLINNCLYALTYVVFGGVVAIWR